MSNHDEREPDAGASPDEYVTDGQTGESYVLGQTFDAKPVVYSVVDGQAIFEGDIVLGTVEEMDRRRALVEGTDIARLDARAGQPDQPGDEPLEGAVIIPFGQFRWADGVVPFEVDPGLPVAQQNAVTGAVAHWRTHSRLNVTQRTAANAGQFPDFIRFTTGSGCSSPVGRQGGRQDIHLAGGCFFGQAVHEIGHSVGLWHEQSREDRNSFVTINFANIDPPAKHNFDQQITDGDDVGTYDYGSIMHYGPTAFSINGQPTITPTQPLPAGVVMGQRTALSAGDRAAVRLMYAALEPSLGNTWIGDFTGDGRSDVLFYLRSRMTWHLGSWATGSLVWTQVGDTTGFGQIGDGRPIWVGDFDGDGSAEVLIYYPGDGNWWLGGVNGGQLQWSLVSNTLGAIAGDPNFGQVWDGRPFWTGNFSRKDATEILIYYPGDDNWWLATWGAGRLSWSFAGNTAGFGHAINDGRPFWIGDFDGDGQADVLMYYPGDGNWWLGSHHGGQLQWRFVGNTMGAARPAPPFPAVCQPLADQVSEITAEIQGLQEELQNAAPGEKAAIVRQIRVLQTRLAPIRRQLADCVTANTPPQPPPWPNFGQVWDGRPFWIGRISRSDRSEVLIYYPGDGNWWLGTLDGPEMQWTFAGNTLGFGQVADGRPFWVADLSGDGRDDITFYSPGDDNWFTAAHANGQLQWRFAGNTAGFGHGINDGRPFWTGKFSRSDKSQLLIYWTGDGHCWLGTDDGNTIGWTLEATFES